MLLFTVPQRLWGDPYAAQLIEKRELQLAAIDEHAIAHGRTFTVLSLEDEEI